MFHQNREIKNQLKIKIKGHLEKDLYQFVFKPLSANSEIESNSKIHIAFKQYTLHFACSVRLCVEFVEIASYLTSCSTYPNWPMASKGLPAMVIVTSAIPTKQDSYTQI